MSLRRLALALPLLVACSSTETVVPTIETADFAPSLGVDLAASTRTTNGVYYRDLVVGAGAAVAAGNTLSVHYTGYLTNGNVFDANGAGDAPFSFHLGAAEVIAGWDEGLAGINVGGRRQLIIPPRLGYGSQGAGSIPPNSILVFTVEVVAAS